MNSFSKKIEIGRNVIGSSSPVYIIAEAGVNHNGDINLARELIDIAVSAGADAVKFQLFNTDVLIKNDVKKATYQVQSSADEQTQYDMLKELEISTEDCASLAEYAAVQGIDFIVTPFDEPSLSFLLSLPLAALKISSTDLTNLAFIEKAAEANVPIILSTGMSEQSEVDQAVAALKDKVKDLILLQCTSSYPAPLQQLNLNVMQKYAEDYGVIVGYSDHTADIGASPFAVAAGACVIEKHFTKDKTLKGPDHLASLSPAELEELVLKIRQVEQMLGSSIKRVELCERENRLALQKCLVASQSIRMGGFITSDNIVARRTGGEGIPAKYLQDLIGKVANRDYVKGEIIDGYR
ncbi:N-acetylneuraminate synthase family protein [Alteromonas macleodii]|uniref:N-acetylneuraminate synthase family protein n=1 Tax=Alteromonas macleodii TaxID=28108 RepID=UPI003BF780B6